eukprot:CAMPEP_0113901182 /NCGR_PEP_ID=MMETSP0780_2-20120614/21103_1 /TAXON_ID=652834 /ORGANISM="Palpitomonas bilix" /LENGTH=625 /DNA_ID=CAMNT_0000893749 /DNA_START=10 /DNA_END=1887 /DNA_ORIENTATION=+ /assembly_acc=CAM_ASM_000599
MAAGGSEKERKLVRCVTAVNAVIIVVSLVFLGVIVIGVVTAPKQAEVEGKDMDTTPTFSSLLPKAELDSELAKYVEVPFTSDLISAMPESEQTALRHLARAAEDMNELYISQIYEGSPAIAEALARQAVAEGEEVEPEMGSPVSGSSVLKSFWFYGGPWNETEEKFIDDAAHTVPSSRLPGGSLYPTTATKEELERWMGGLSGAEHDDATSFFTVIRKEGASFKSIPYSEEYASKLAGIAESLQKAADSTSDEGLKKYLEARAAAFFSNDYGESDYLWLGLNSSIDPTIGPYESYSDEHFAYKAFFEAYICVVRPKETEQLQELRGVLQYVEDNLPVSPSLRNPSLGAGAAIKVVDQVYSGGEARSGVQTIAFNLPNNATTTSKYGTKRVMMRNANLAKFDRILRPIAERLVEEEQLDLINFDAFFLHVLAHELMHGLGPHTVNVNCSNVVNCLDGKDVREVLAEHYSAIEEGKADISGLWAIQFLHDNPPNGEPLSLFSSGLGLDSFYVTFLASAFRSLRFGAKEAHAQGIAIQLQQLMEKGAVTRNETTNRYRVNLENMDTVKTAVEEITGMMMTIQANGDKAGAARLKADAVAAVEAVAGKDLEKLSDIPVDVRPVFALAPY